MKNANHSTVNMAKLASSSVQISDGSEFLLGRVWKNQTAILVFLRHFACIGCRAHAKQVWDNRAAYEKGGGKIVFVGNGESHFISKFREDLDLKEALIVTDPSLEVFRAAGFNRGFSYILQTKTIVNAFKLFKDGHRQTTYTKEAGTHWQLGGILAVSTKGSILYHYVSEYLGDFPEEPYIEIIKADETAARQLVTD